MKATVLVDNIGTEDLAGEWGLSFFIEFRGKKVLLDAGADGLFAENAGKLGISLNEADYAVLSHAHYDNADGMAEFFALNTKAKLYLRESCGENCYKEEESRWKYIGIRKGLLEQYKDRIVRVSGDVELEKGMWLIPHKTCGLENAGMRERMYLRDKEYCTVDGFSHEQSLVFDTGDGLAVFNSCSHGGADNIIAEVSDTFPGRRVRIMAGGFHLFNKTEEYVSDFAKKLRDTGVEQIWTGHCTGGDAYQILKKELGGMVHQLKAGAEISLG